MTDLTTVTIQPPRHTLPDVSTPKYKSFLGRILATILKYTIEAKINPPKSNLARAVVASHKQSPLGKLAPLHHTDPGKVRAYTSYVAYCTKIGVEPRTIEQWDEQREQQRITTTQEDSLLNTKEKQHFTIEAFVDGKVKRHLQSLSATGKRLREVPRYFPSMVKEKVGSASTDAQDHVVKRRIVRVVSVSEDRSGYVWHNRLRAEVQAPIEPACLHRVERPVTFDRHVARSASSPFFFRGTGAPLNVEKPINIDLTPGALKITPEWANRNDLKVNALKPSKKEKKLPFKSCWCVDCKEYVEQSHKHQHSADAHLKHWRYYTTATALHDARPLDPDHSQQRAKRWKVQAQRSLNHLAKLCRNCREAVREVRDDVEVIWHELFWYKVCLNCRPAFMQHKAVWVQSFGGLFTHMMRRMTSVADRFKVRDLNTINVVSPSKPYAGDYLAWKNPRTCTHPNLRTITFKCTGETIKMCPDCTAFDEERQKVLKTVNIDRPESSQLREWNDRLKLSAERAAFHPTLLWGTSIEVEKYLVSTEEESFTHCVVNTAGVVSRDGEGKDSCSRDLRAKATLREEKEHVTLTKSMCWCCGAELWERKGTNFCPDTDCAQRFQEEKQSILELIKSINELTEMNK